MAQKNKVAAKSRPAAKVAAPKTVVKKVDVKKAAPSIPVSAKKAVSKPPVKSASVPAKGKPAYEMKASETRTDSKKKHAAPVPGVSAAKPAAGKPAAPKTVAAAPKSSAPKAPTVTEKAQPAPVRAPAKAPAPIVAKPVAPQPRLGIQPSKPQSAVAAHAVKPFVVAKGPTMPARVLQQGAGMARPAAPASPKELAQNLAAQKKPVSQRHGFKTNEFIVYPAHGVGRIVGIEEQEIAGMSLELFVITFDKDKMTLRVPTGKLQSVGMRKLSEENVVRKAMETLKGRARIKRTMWSRRAQEYEAKINSGDLVSIAEVVRDLYRSEQQPEQSYSERQLYEAALDRMAREIAAVEKTDERGAVQRITEVLSKSAKGRRLAAEGAAEEGEGEGAEAA